MEKLGVCLESVSVALVLSRVIISLSPSFLSVSLIWSLSLTLCTYTASAVSRQGQSAPRTGFFHFFKRQEVFIQGVVNYIPPVDAFVTETRMESSDKHIFQGPTKGSTWLPHSKINESMILSRHGYLFLPFEPLQVASTGNIITSDLHVPLLLYIARWFLVYCCTNPQLSPVQQLCNKLQVVFTAILING